MTLISPQEVAQAFEKRRRLRPAVVYPEMAALDVRLFVQRVLFWTSRRQTA